MAWMIVFAVVLLPAGAGCQLGGSEGGLHLSRMIPKPELFGGVPSQTEPEPKATGPESPSAAEERP